MFLQALSFDNEFEAGDNWLCSFSDSEGQGWLQTQPFKPLPSDGKVAVYRVCKSCFSSPLKITSKIWILSVDDTIWRRIHLCIAVINLDHDFGFYCIPEASTVFSVYIF